MMQALSTPAVFVLCFIMLGISVVKYSYKILLWIYRKSKDGSFNSFLIMSAAFAFICDFDLVVIKSIIMATMDILL